MNEFIGSAGLLLGLTVLITLALRGIDIVFAALVSSLVVIVTNGLPLAESLMQGFALGPLGTFISLWVLPESASNGMNVRKVGCSDEQISSEVKAPFKMKKYENVASRV